VDEVPKILPNSQVTFEADARIADAEARLAALDARVAVEHPADGTMSPPVSNDGPGDPEPVVRADDAPVPDAAPAPEPAVAAPKSPPRRPPSGGPGA
jgi:hypothetical protein